MTRYHIVPCQDGWKIEIEGTKSKKVYKTKKEAILESQKMAHLRLSSVIIHTRTGKITSVRSYSGKTKVVKILSANVKHKLSNSFVRNQIAEVLYTQSKSKQAI